MFRNLLLLPLLLSWDLIPFPAFAGHAEPFLWGVANAAFQVEGAPAPSDWKEWTQIPGKIADGTNAEVATDFIHHYDEDFKLARRIGATTFRISIPWERIEPSEGVWDDSALKMYENMIVDMRSHGLEPLVTLHHFVLPLWLSREGGLLAPHFVKRFTEYAIHVVSALAPPPASVKWWITFNEPGILVDNAYVTGLWPPGAKNHFLDSILALVNIGRAHSKAFTEMKRAAQQKHSEILVSVAHHWRTVEPFTNSLEDRLAAKIANSFFNLTFLSMIRPSLDYLGLNYYGRTIVTSKGSWPFFGTKPGPGPKSDLGWEIYPEGLHKALLFANSFHLPILVTENGVADSEDKVRADFLREHIEALQRARDEGVTVLGYLYWSLTDNFEWASGLTPRFGLVAIDYATLKRVPRPSAEIYSQLIRDASLR